MNNQTQPVKAEEIKNLAMQNEKQVKSPEAVLLDTIKANTNLKDEDGKISTWQSFWMLFDPSPSKNIIIKAIELYHAQFTHVEQIPVNCLHAKCPKCGENVDVIPADGTVINKPVEPVQGSLEEIAKEYFGKADKIGMPYSKDAVGFFIDGLNAGSSYQRSIEKDGWIAVGDELPDEGKIVDTWNGIANRRAKYEKERFNRHVEITSGMDRVISCSYPDVTHWRKLPSPPKQL